MNTYLTPAQASAQFMSLIVLATIARWYIIPWLNSHARADALIALLWVHVFRYVALQVFSAQAEGFPISNGGAMEIVIGDVAGAVIAFTAIALLRRRSRLAIPLAWLLAFRIGLGPNGIFVAIAIAQSALAVTGVLMFRRGKWKGSTV